MRIWICAFLLLSLAQSLTVAKAEQQSVTIEPGEITSCGCRTLAYEVAITNEDDRSIAINLGAYASDPSIWASLKPEVLVLGPNSQESLRMYVKTPCNIQPGRYAITVYISTISGCEIVSDRVEAFLVVPLDCYPPIELPPEEPEEEEPEVTSNVSISPAPTGELSGAEPLDLWKVSTVLLLVAVVILLAYITGEKKR
ncbi:MAG: hypothetical protein JXB14_08355 [Candidatus Altiarchaeota archaeon]|nr:hypothetical protein [Candidatus Altiarchaeota archaeon]